MAIHREGKYLVDVDLQGRLSVGIESGRVAGCVAEAIRRGAQGVFGSADFRFREDNLDFLTQLAHLEMIWFWDVALKNIDGVYALSRLRHFRVQGKRPGVDFQRLGTLEELIWEYNPKDTGLASLDRLRMLHLWHYKPKHKSFEGLELPRSLTELQIYWANPETLAGLPALPGVTQFEVHRCRNLKTLDELPRIAPNVEHLVVTSSGRVADGAEGVKHLPKLRHAYVRDALLVSR